MKRKDYNTIKWEDYFYLDETSPSGLRWKVDRMRGKGHKITAAIVYAGDVAGTLLTQTASQHNSWRVRLNGTGYLVHRVIHVMLYGSIDSDMVIDHLNGDGSDNTIQNLSLKNQRANNQNCRKRLDNTSGVAGVRMSTHLSRGIPYTNWVARWCDVSRKECSKAFSTNKYGYDEAFELAVAYRNEQIKLLNSAGQCYTERHLKNTN